MSHIFVKNIINSHIAVSMPAGDKLYQELLRVWGEGDKITIDFIEIETCATPFFNASIGRLLKNNTIEQLQQKLAFVNISDGARDLLNRVIANAIAFYANEEQILQLVNTPVED